MNSQFLIRPEQLNQAFESNSGGGANDVTRRSFIKRTGGATVATLVAWNLGANTATAAEGDGSGSGLVYGMPGAPTGYVETGIVTWSDYKVKGIFSISPPAGYSSTEVVVTMNGAGWVTSDFSGTLKLTPAVTLTGKTAGTLECNPNALTTYWAEIDRHDVEPAVTALAASKGGVTRGWVVYVKMEISSILTSPDGRSLAVAGKCYLHRHSITTDYSTPPIAAISESDEFSASKSMVMNVTYDLVY